MYQVSITIHNWSLDVLGWSNNVTGEKSVCFKGEKEGRKKKSLSGMERIWGQSKRLNLSGIWTYPIWTFPLFFLKKKKVLRILSGAWRMLEFIQHLNLYALNLSGLDCNSGLSKNKPNSCRQNFRVQMTKQYKAYKKAIHGCGYIFLPLCWL